MQKTKILFFFLCFHIFFTQTQRFFYDLEINNPKIKKNSEKFTMVLDVDKDWVKFYDVNFLEIDSINQKSHEGKTTTTSESGQLLVRKFATNHNQKYENLLLDYFQINTEDKFNWKILNETKKIGEYNLQKAQCKFGGRDWTAWFCSEIPINEGPYKFRALPGLIFEIEDSQKYFIYKLTNSKKLANTYSTQDFLETNYQKKPIIITLKQYFKIKLNEYNDPFANLKKIMNEEGGIIMIDNRQITNIEELNLNVKFTQKAIINDYLPLELDKAIPYPKN